MKQEYTIGENVDGKTIQMTYFSPLKGNIDSAVLILPGGAYSGHADYEGEGYAQMFNMFGIHAFVLNYSVSPNHFPAPLVDARRAMCFIRKNAEKFGINKEKILVIGSSAGGHLAALLCAYREDIGMENELMPEDYLPNAQILCYPVISAEAGIMHMGSYQNLLGCKYFEREKYAPDLLVCEDTPKAFIWHTAADNAVSVINSYRYAEALVKQNIPCEMHIFPYGVHGLGVSPHNTHVAQWVELLRSWLHLHEFI